MAIAAIWGTTVGYTDYNHRVTLETSDNRVAVINKSTFEYLYHKLDEFTAALKEDCIQYAINELDYSDKCLFEYPEWYVDAVADGIIYESCSGACIFNDDDGELAMSPNSMILRNYKGELKYMESYDFHKYYDTLRE